MTSDAAQTQARKSDHLAFFTRPETQGQGTWLSCVRLIHQALPELALSDIDLRTRFAGHEFRAPLFISGMTGGTDRALEINGALARLVEREGIGLGVGSQRAMLEDPQLAKSYILRHVAPTAFIAGNLGAVQAREAGPARVVELVKRIGANALCLHLNVAQELTQPEGDHDFRGLYDSIARLNDVLHVPLIVKETGAGLSREVASRLAALGVTHIDVSGAGGTSWVGVELSRRGDNTHDGMADFADWGLPTAASLLETDGLGLTRIASGGLRSGLDAARAFALGADLAGFAAPFLRAYFAEGEEGLAAHYAARLQELTSALLLCGLRRPSDLKTAPRVLLSPLREWQTARGL